MLLNSNLSILSRNLTNVNISINFQLRNGKLASYLTYDIFGEYKNEIRSYHNKF